VEVNSRGSFEGELPLKEDRLENKGLTRRELQLGRIRNWFLEALLKERIRVHNLSVGGRKQVGDTLIFML